MKKIDNGPSQGGDGRELVFSARRKDFRIDTFKAGGKGGQHQNKTDSGVRITHIESGLSVESRNSRSQHMNKRDAFRRLAALLVEHYVLAPARERVTGAITVRTYHEPDNRVKDHASGLQLSWDEVVGKGDLSRMIDSRAVALNSPADSTEGERAR